MTDQDERHHRGSCVLGASDDECTSGAYALPPAAALLTDRAGVIVAATVEVAALAGFDTPEPLVGRSSVDVLCPLGSRLLLAGEVPVRAVTWPHPDAAELDVTVLVDVSDEAGVTADESEPTQPEIDGKSRLLAAQRISRVGSWVYHPRTGRVERGAVLRELIAESGTSSVSKCESPVIGVHADDQSKLQDFYESVAASEPGELFSADVRDESGQRVFCLSARAERDESGVLDRVEGTVQDVTRHRQLERELRSEWHKLHDAQRLARLGTWQWDPVTDDVHLSSVLREVLKKSLDAEFTYDAFLRSVHPQDREWVRQALRTLVDSQNPVEIEHRYVRSDGSNRIIRLHAAAVEDDAGKLVVVGTAQDVTEQRSAVTRMERSSQRFTDLVAVTPVGIGLFDETERLVDANDALCELLGYRADELRGMTVLELARTNSPPMPLRDAADEAPSLDGGRKGSQRLLYRSDGKLVYCELHVALSVQDDGSRFWLVVFQDITERRRAAEVLRYQAMHDDLTGLPNRAAVKEWLSQVDSTNIAVLFCDIDEFKRINDSLGHDAGDELLVALARRLDGGLPEHCSAARLSGDEFVIFCSDVSGVGGVHSLATRVSVLLRTAVPVRDQLIRVSASIGAAVPSASGDTGEDLLRFADAAMFEAKGRGAGKVSLASPALIASADRQLQLEGQLREALNNDGLALHYQPVVDSDGTIVTAEALVRWPHPERGLLSPDMFLPVAEQGDLLRELDRWVLRTALCEAASWTTGGGNRVAIAVNLAGLVPGGPDFVDIVADTIAESGLDYSQVVLELVETALVDLPSRTRKAMGDLVDRGVRFAVDDFGTGYSSLARLKDLPAQIIKVDRRFVSGVGGDASDYAVAKAVVDMARAMGRECVAEGVETATQFNLLSEVGVNAYQGWLFSKAVPAAEFSNLVALGPLQTPTP